MAVQTPAYLKSRFETGDTPSAQDFIDLIDSMTNVASIVVFNGDVVTFAGEVVTKDS